MTVYSYMNADGLIDKKRYIQDQFKIGPQYLLNQLAEAAKLYQEGKRFKEEQAVRKQYADDNSRKVQQEMDMFGYTKEKDKRYFDMQQANTDFNQAISGADFALGTISKLSEAVRAGADPRAAYAFAEKTMGANPITAQFLPALANYGGEAALQKVGEFRDETLRIQKLTADQLAANMAPGGYNDVQKDFIKSQTRAVDRSGSGGGYQSPPPNIDSSSNYLTETIKEGEAMKDAGSSTAEIRKFYEDSMAFMLPVHRNQLRRAMPSEGPPRQGPPRKTSPAEQVPPQGNSPGLSPEEMLILKNLQRRPSDIPGVEPLGALNLWGNR